MNEENEKKINLMMILKIMQATFLSIRKNTRIEKDTQKLTVKCICNSVFYILIKAEMKKIYNTPMTYHDTFVQMF